MDIRTLVGRNIRRLRRASSISQEELAARIDADQAYISRLESGQVNVTVTVLQAIAAALKVRPKAFFDE